MAKLSKIARNVEFVLATNADELHARADDTLDLAIVELSIPGTHGYSHVDELRHCHPDLPVIVLSGCSDPVLICSILERGVLGFIPKTHSSEVMLSAVRLVLAGGVYVPPLILQALHSEAAAPGAPPGNRVAQTQECLRNALTERQMAVLELLSQGKPNKLIGRALNISEGTVKIHLAAIFRALNVRNRTEAVIAAQSFTG